MGLTLVICDQLLVGGEQEEGSFLTWRHLMYFQHCADLLTKPLLAPLPLNVQASELQALWVAGVAGVVVEVGVGRSAGRLIELRQIIDGLTLPSQRKRREPSALIPYIGDQVSTVAEEEEEE